MYDGKGCGMSRKCPCCNGTGVIEVGGGMSDAALMRRELVRVWDMVGLLTDFLTALMEESGGAITGLVGELGGVRSQLHSQNEEISSLQKRLAIHASWNCRTRDNPEHYAALMDYREASQLYQSRLAAEPASGQITISGVLEGTMLEGTIPEGPKRGGSEEPRPEGATPEGSMPEGATPEGQEVVVREEPATEEPATEEPATEEPATEEPATEEPATEEPATEEPATEEPATEEPATEEPQESRRQFRRKMETHENGTQPKKAGGQPNHKGRSRNTKPDRTVRLTPELCVACGTVPDRQVKIIRMRVYDVDENERGNVTCTMCVIYVLGCSVCGAENRPDTDLVIPGTSFGPMLRRIVTAYHEAHVVEADMKKLLEDLEKADFSKGAISNCVSTVAAHLNAQPVCLPYEEPVVLSEDLREYRSPIRPRPVGDSDFEKQDAALTCNSNLWTSSMTQPILVQTMERASMDPHAATDESPNHIGKEEVQTLVSLTPHTVRIHITPRKDAEALRRKHPCKLGRWERCRRLCLLPCRPVSV